MNVLLFVVGALAVWRVTHLLSSEDGPFDVVARVRRLAGAGVIGQALDCLYCLSLWIAAPIAWWMESEWRERVLLWLALSAAAILINRVADGVAPDRPVYVEAAEANTEPNEINVKEQS